MPLNMHKPHDNVDSSYLTQAKDSNCNRVVSINVSSSKKWAATNLEPTVPTNPMNIWVLRTLNSEEPNMDIPIAIVIRMCAYF